MRAQFVLAEILTGIRRNFSMVLSVILVTFVSLTFVGSAILMQMQISSMKDYWYDKVQVAVFLCPADSQAPTCTDGEVSEDQRAGVEAALQSEDLGAYVDEVYYEDKATAYRLFEEQFAGTSLAGTVPEDQMQESFRVKLQDPQQYEIIREYFASTPGVEEVVDQNRLLDQLFNVMNVATAIAIGVAALMLLCAVLLIATTIRLSAFSRRRETGIMRLVGASNGFIQLPFVLEGVVAALIGAVLASGALAAVVYFFVGGWLQPRAVGFTLVDLGDIALVGPALILIGVLMAAISSVVTLRRYLKV